MSMPADGLKESFQVVGHWKAVLSGSDGRIKQVVENRNVICTNGKEWLANFIYSAAATASTFTMKYIAVGTGSTAETAADTALNTESIRQTGTVSYVSNQIWQVTATFATGSGTGNLTEFGLFSSSTGGTMFARFTRTAINKTSTDTLVVTAQITLN